MKLVGSALTNKTLNKWGVRNILKTVWGEFGDVKINWVQGNTFIIIVKDDEAVTCILNQMSWAIMSQNFSVKRRPRDLALEEIMLGMVPFWIQITGVPLHLSTKTNARKLANVVGEVLEIEDLSLARGFLWVRVSIDTTRPLISGCWLPWHGDKESWIEFRYERFQDFCYCYGGIGYVIAECSFAETNNRGVTFDEWIRTKQHRPGHETA